MDLHPLLPSGTHIIVHSTDWFTSPGSGNHTQTKYNSNDARTAAAQDSDMIARHIDARVLDHYSQFNTTIDGAAQKIRDDLAARCISPQNCPLLFAIVEDQGAVTRTQGSRTGCSTTDPACLQASILQDLCYMNATYFGTAAYWKMNPSTRGWQTSTNPVVGFFPPSSTAAWNTAVANLKALTAANGWAAANCPAGQQQANGGLLFYDSDTTNVGLAQYSGGSSWVGTLAWSATNQFLIDGANGNFHESLYQSCAANPSAICIGSAKKGFDDNIPDGFGSNRVTAQECGQTWALTIGKMLTSFVGSNANFQLVTWNDYEESTEIESGIDNCYRLTGTISITSGVLDFSHLLATNDATYAPLSPTNGTIDHFTVWACDVNDLHCLNAGQVALTVSSLDLSGLPAGSYHIWVQMVGINSIQNRMSGSFVSFTH